MSGGERQTTFFFAHQLFHHRAVGELDTHFCQDRGKLIRKCLKTTLVSSQPGGTRVQPCPHPRHVHLVGVFFAEFTHHQRFPHLSVHLLASPFLHPLGYGGLFHGLPAVGEAQIQPYQPKADLVQSVTQPWVEQRAGDGIKGVKLAFVIHYRFWA